MSQSSIEWTQMTWNPTTGCDKISAGCKYCYAEVMSKRLQAMGLEKYKNAFALTLHAEAINIPYTWNKPKVVFVNSMSDLFHKNVPLSFIKKVFEVMNNTPQHTYQVLTKRAERLVELQEQLTWTSNIWMGVSVEDEKVTQRIDFLRQTNAKVKFLSCEPLIGPLMHLNLTGIDWVIVGGESGKNARPMEEWWVWDIKQQCQEQELLFFFKQWGGANKKKAGRLLAGNTYSEMPSGKIFVGN
jgi:protein gp37